MPTPVVSRLFVYPIKSLGRAAVGEAIVLPSGALAHDRQLALFDSAANFVNGKRDERIHGIRAAYDLDRFTVTLGVHEKSHSETFHLADDRDKLTRWFSDFFGMNIRIGENIEVGFPDDLGSPGPTIVSQATLEEVSRWFAPMTLDQAASRFRANIAIGGVPPFWEDRLFGNAGEELRFAVGAVNLIGVNPCQRCVVPSRDPATGEVWNGFQKRFSDRRKASLPEWSNSTRFPDYYRLSVNTRAPRFSAGGRIQVGDRLARGPAANHHRFEEDLD